MAAFTPSSATTGPGRDNKRSNGGEMMAFPMKAATVIWRGDLVVLDVTDGLVWALQSDAAGATETGDFFAGVAAESKTSVVAGEMINCYVTGIFAFENNIDSLDPAYCGLVCYADCAVAGSGTPHNITITDVAANALLVGRLLPPCDATDTEWRVRINGYAGVIATST